jgi:maltose O-acetyltransferase
MSLKEKLKAIALSRQLSGVRAFRRWVGNQLESVSAACRDAWWNGIVASRAMPDTTRMFFYKHCSRLALGYHSYIKCSCSFENKRIRIGDHCYINRGVQFYGDSDITIGSDCAIGCEALFITVSHSIDFQDRRAGKGLEEPIVVGDGVWIGSRVMVLPGTIIKEGCIIAAGAVVRGVCDAHGLYGGVPARRLKDLPMGSFFYPQSTEAPVSQV